MNNHENNLPGSLPGGWTVKRIKDIAHLSSGDFIEPEKIAAEGEYAVFGGNGVRGFTDSFTHSGTFVLIGRQGALCGNINYATGKFWATEHAVVATPIKKLSTVWLGELLRTMNLNQHSNAAAQPGLAIERIRLLRLPVPPLPEQQRIASYLDANCAAIDAAVAAKCRQLETLDAMRNTMIESAVTRGIQPEVRRRRVNQDWIGEIPEHWAACRIKRVVSQVDYGISESSEPEGKFAVLKMGNIQCGEIVFTKIEFVEEVSDSLLLEKGDLLYNRTNSPDQVGKAAVFRGSKADGITFASYLVRLRTNYRADPYFLNYLLNSSGFLSFARKLAIPSVQQSNLNSTRYCRMLIPLPPRKEQEVICAHLDHKVGDLKHVSTGIESQLATLTAYRKSLIHECVTGQRRITEAGLEKTQHTEATPLNAHQY